MQTLGAMSVERTDTELLASWGAGCRDSANELIDRYFPTVHRFFRNKVGAEIEDLVQQTFLACVEGRERFKQHSSFKTFLLGIARYQLFTHYHKRRRERLDFSLSSTRDLGTSPTGIVAKREDEQLVVRALQQIPLDAQIVLELAYWEELDGLELARVLEVPLNTAYSRLRRAKLSLRTKLRELAPDRGDSEPIRAWLDASDPGITQR
jgi:RNA polymerase sigma factor (sigma-70 family)